MKQSRSSALNKVRHATGGTIANILVALLSITCIYPVIWMIYSSLKSQQEFSLDTVSFPKVVHFENYIQSVEEGNIGSYFLNSLFDTLVTLAFVLVIAFVIGYCLSRFRFVGRNLIYYMFLAGMLIPIYALLIPIFIEFKDMELLNKRITLILPYIAFALPIAVFLVESYVRSIPGELEEAACIDGCSPVHTMFSIIMPLCSPVLATSAILTFLNTWNEFPLALVLIRSNKLKTIPLGLTNFVGTYTVNYPLMMAAMVISVLPVIIIYLLFYNKIMEGTVVGAVKG